VRLFAVESLTQANTAVRWFRYYHLNQLTSFQSLPTPPQRHRSLARCVGPKDKRSAPAFCQCDGSQAPLVQPRLNDTFFSIRTLCLQILVALLLHGLIEGNCMCTAFGFCLTINFEERCGPGKFSLFTQDTAWQLMISVTQGPVLSANTLSAFKDIGDASYGMLGA
jgi:hypothetical protein